MFDHNHRFCNLDALTHGLLTESVGHLSLRQCLVTHGNFPLLVFDHGCLNLSALMNDLFGSTGLPAMSIKCFIEIYAAVIIAAVMCVWIEACAMSKRDNIEMWSLLH